MEEFIILKDSSKKLTVILFCALIVLSMQASAACTGIYVGQDATSDGSIILARSNDHQEVWGNHVTVNPRVENQSGRFMPISLDGSVKAEIPATTYKYTATPFLNSTIESNGLNTDASVSTNEYGVAMTMSITATANDAALKADPLVENGLTELTATDYVVCQSKTAREAVELLLKTIDKYGSSESNTAFIADQNEAWYVEMYNGHQYAAVKLPSDKAAVFGNEYSIEYLSDYEDNITSENLTNLAEENGFAVHGKNNEINLLDTYSGDEVRQDPCHMRTWIGHQVLAPLKYNDDYNKSTDYPLCFKPEMKVSAEDVCQLLRNRYEGTKYCPDETGRVDMRVIGTEIAMSAHVIQVFPDLPAEMSCINWISSGPAVYGVFVPLSNDCINVSDAYGADQPAKDGMVFDTSYPYYLFKNIATHCSGPDNHKIYGKPVQEYWHKAQSNMFSSMKSVIDQASKMDGDARASYITSYCNDMQNKAFEDGKVILNNLTWIQSKNSNSFKIERDSQGQWTDKEEVIPPMELNLDASGYKNVPSI